MAEGGGLQDDELYLPRTVVNKLIKEMVPNIRVSNDARDLLLNCCSGSHAHTHTHLLGMASHLQSLFPHSAEFIHLLASEANEESEKQQKKVISPEHVLEALSTLGFPEYIEDVKAVHKEYKEQASKHRRRGKSRLERLGIPEEELLRQQQQLFEEARQQHLENDLLEQQRLQQAQPQSTTHSSLHTQSPSQSPPLTSSSPLISQTSSTHPPPPPVATSSTNIQPVTSSPTLHTSSPSQPSLLPANLQATANLLQSLTSQQAALNRAHPSQPALSLPQILPLSPAVLQAMQSGHTAGLLQASQTASLLQAARATELLRVQVAAQQASLAAQQQQLQLMQQQQKQGGGGGGLKEPQALKMEGASSDVPAETAL